MSIKFMRILDNLDLVFQEYYDGLYQRKTSESSVQVPFFLWLGGCTVQKFCLGDLHFHSKRPELDQKTQSAGVRNLLPGKYYKIFERRVKLLISCLD